MPIVPPRFLAARPRRLHSTRRWSQFGHVNRGLSAMVRDLTGAAALAPGAHVLDFGCGTAPYRDTLPRGVRYTGADLPGNDRADVELRDDGTLPVPDGSVDLVLSTQVLEHVRDPDVYLRECARVLRPGGSLVLSTHGAMYYHRDPDDYWRWTMPGLALLLERTGFEVADRRGVLGLSAAAVQVFQDATVWSVPAWLRPLYLLAAQTAVRRFDRRATPADRLDNGLVIAVRAVRASRTG